MMVADEAQVCHQTTEPIPARERLSLDQQTAKPACALDIRVDLRHELRKIFSGQWPFGRDGKDTVGLVQLMFNHLFLR
jgi:hypothetical protein